jgi:tRNA-specific 2-thiouridylase
MNDILLLKLGRQFRLSPASKLVVGRNEQENRTIAHLVQSGDILLEVENVGSPLALMRGHEHQEFLALAAGICKRYSDARETPSARVRVWETDSRSASHLIAQNPEEKYIRSLMITE